MAACRDEAGPGATRLPDGALGRIKDKFKQYNVGRASIMRIWAGFRKQRDEGISPMSMQHGARRIGRAAVCTKLTPEIADKLVEINDKNFGKLPDKKLAGKLSEAMNISGGKETVRRWCKVLGAQK